MEEIWKPVPGYEQYYQVSNLGRVKGHAGKVLSLETHWKGYKTIKLHKPGFRKKWYVHRLVMLAFVGPSELLTNHKDGNKANNRLDNLEYCTQSENMAHAVANGLSTPPDKYYQTFRPRKTPLTDKEKNEIRQSSYLTFVLSKRYGVSVSVITAIKNGKL